MDFRSFLAEPMGQSSLQLAELALAFVLSASIGLALCLWGIVASPTSLVLMRGKPDRGEPPKIKPAPHG
jgi:ABC-type transport system involved in cytochrome c biogenesis permease subunit